MISQISPERFTWDTYLNQQHFSVIDLISADYKILKPGVTPVGYCDAGRIKIRPRPEQFALMVECDGKDVWFHVQEIPEI